MNQILFYLNALVSVINVRKLKRQLSTSHIIKYIFEKRNIDILIFRIIRVFFTLNSKYRKNKYSFFFVFFNVRRLVTPFYDGKDLNLNCFAPGFGRGKNINGKGRERDVCHWFGSDYPN